VAFSDGTIEKGIKLDRKELKRKQRTVSRAKKGSNNRKKKVTALAKEWERTTDRENNAIHRLTSKAVKKCNHIAMEYLQITNMVKNPYLSKRVFNCMYCGYSEDSDINASKNVLNKYK